MSRHFEVQHDESKLTPGMPADEGTVAPAAAATGGVRGGREPSGIGQERYSHPQPEI